jgi:RNA polymerase sigma-70 factor, ECF subfamily
MPAVAAYIRSLTGSFHDAQDILQEVSVIVVRKYAQYDRAKPFVAWAIGIARNEVLAYRRDKYMDRQVFDNVAVERLADAFAETSSQPDDLLEALAKCVKKVPDRTRKLLQLRYLEDLKYEQIAELVQAGTSAVKVALHRVRSALRDCVTQRLARRGSA